MRTPLYKMRDDIFTEIVSKSKTLKEITTQCNALGYGADTPSIKKRIALLQLSADHLAIRHKVHDASRLRYNRWTVEMPDEEFKKIISQVNSMSMFCFAAGRKYSTHVSRIVRARAAQLGVSLDHFLYSGPIRYGSGARLDQVLIANSPVYNTPSTEFLKNRLLKEGIIQDVCQHCGTGPEWEGQPLRLHLYRINGIPGDHRLENLLNLCPNCHSIWASKNNRSKSAKKSRMTRLERERIRQLKELAK